MRKSTHGSEEFVKPLTRMLQRKVRLYALITALLLSLSGSALAYNQWEWTAVKIMDNRGGLILTGPTTTFNSSQEALAALQALGPGTRVLTQLTGARTASNGRPEYHFVAPPVTAPIGPWVYDPGSCCLTFSSEAAVVEYWRANIASRCNPSIVITTQLGPWNIDSIDGGQRVDKAVLTIHTSGCSAPDPILQTIDRVSQATCPDGYANPYYGKDPSHQTDCINEVVAVIRGGALECPVGAPSAIQGNPCNAATGDKSQSETDYSAPGISFSRHYHSAVPSGDANLGAGWSHSYGAKLVFDGSTPSLLVRPGGNHEILEVGADIRSVSGSGTRLFHVGTEWQARLSNGDKEVYSATGELQRIERPSGATTTLFYAIDPDSSQRKLASVVGPFGHRLDFTYVSGRIDSVATTDGGTIHYAYDTAANLTKVTFQDGTFKRYLYEDTRFPNSLTGIIDESGTRFSTYTYDSIGRVASSERAGGAGRITLSYTNTDSTVLDAAGTQTNYTFNTFSTIPRRVSGITRAGVLDQYTLAGDSQRRVTRHVDRRGIRTDYTYDSDHVLTVTEAVGTASERKTTYSYLTSEDDLVTLQSISTPSGGIIREVATAYDTQRRPTSTTISGPDGSGGTVSRTTSMTYATTGQVQTIDGPRTDVTDVDTYAYYSCSTGYECGQVKTIANALNQITTFNTYNADGQPTRITDPNGLVVAIAYDARLRVTDRCEGGTLPGCASGELTHLDYWPTGLLKRVTSPNGSFVEYTYDAAHRLTEIKDGANNKIVYTLDANGNPTAENIYDPTLALKRTHSRVFNSLNQLWKDINAAGTANATTEFGYDNNGNQTSANAPLSRNSTNVYDELDRLKQVTDPNAGVTLFGFDANDNLTSVTDPRALVTSYNYNGLGDLRTQTSPDTGTTTKTYDSGGNLKTNTDARNAITTYTYDSLNRVATAAYKIGTTTDQTITYTYDAGTNGKGRLTGASDANHTLSWTYDAHGRVTNKTQTVGTITKAIGYGYNSSGQLTALTLPSGQVIQYAYNSNNQLTSLVLVGNPNVTILNNVTYDPFGPVTGWSWGSGAFASRVYDTDGKLTNVSSSGASVGNRTFGYDDAFRITSTTDTGTGGQSWTLGYDLLDRLNSATTTSTTIGYTYDANGNRLSQTGTSASTYMVSGSSNSLSSVSGALARSYTYDNAGNSLTTGATTHTYYNSGRMKTAKLGAASSTTYTYNALGQRVKKNGPGGGFYYAYDEGGHLVGEYTSTGATIEETVWLGDIPVASLRPNSPSGTIIYYVHTDQLNTPRKVTNNNSNLTLRWSWDPAPFGEGTNEPKESPTGLSSFKYNLRFPGQLFDAESNLYYNYFRDYDPAVGRYVESDPIGVSGGINTYAYVRGLPSSRIDPFGLCDDEEKKAECDQKLSDMLLAIFGRRLDGSQGPKGMAQRYQQMGRQLPDDVRKGYEEQFRNRQKNLRKRAKDYEDSGCGPPPLEIIEWMNKDVPTPPPPQADADGINGDWLLLLILIREASRLFPPSNLVPVL